MRILREPLLHFLVIGAVLFALFQVAGDEEAPTDEIVLTQGRIEQLASSFALVWQRPPTPEELNGLVEEYIREEVLYREAVAMGLDRDDTIIRRRMRQKLEFLTEDLTSQMEPTEEGLRTWFRENEDAYLRDEQFTFDHIYFNHDRRGDDLDRDIQQALAQLAADEGTDPSTLGDPLLIANSFEAISRTRVEQTFGTTFITSLENLRREEAELASGAWSGPLTSGYGQHLVRVTERIPGGIPEFEAVREAVQRDWSNAKRLQVQDAFYEGLRERYTIRTEDSTPEPDREDRQGVPR